MRNKFLLLILLLGATVATYSLPKISMVESVEIDQVVITFSQDVDMTTPVQISYFDMGRIVPAKNVGRLTGRDDKFVAEWENPMPVGDVKLVIGEEVAKVHNLQPTLPSILEASYKNGEVTVNFNLRFDPVTATSVTAYQIRNFDGTPLNPSTFFYFLDYDGYSLRPITMKTNRSVTVPATLPPGNYMIIVSRVRAYGGNSVGEFVQKYNFLVQ